MTTDEFLARELMGIPAEVYQILVNQHEVKWHPTQDITQALGDGGKGTVVGMMRKRGYMLRLESETYPDSFSAEFGPQDEWWEDGFGSGYSTSPAAAISEAARKAIEGEKGRIRE